MSEAKHTPGPWRLDDEIHCGVLGGDYHSIDAGCGFHREGEVHGLGFGLMAFMRLEDARLIASAPDLLHALQRIVNNPEAQIGGHIRAEAVAAIRKATGTP